VLFDYGGVLTTPVSHSFAAFCLSTGVNPERMKDVLASAYSGAPGSPRAAGDLEGLVEAVETGRLGGAEFERRLAAALSDGLSKPLESVGLTERLFAALRAEERMLGAVSAIRDHGLKTGVISNTWGRHTTPSEQEGLFDVFIRSGVEGLRKPLPEIYLLAAERLRVGADECVFVDDIPVNVEGARAAGMTGVLHKDPAITIPRLEELLGLDLA
jgi:epoxide hydrolase-like predicted phosphatase